MRKQTIKARVPFSFSTSSLDASATVVSSITQTSVTITSLVSGTTYYFRVTAVVGSTESAKSNEQSATPNGNVVQDSSFEDTSVDISGDLYNSYAYDPTTANWTFNENSGIEENGSALPNAATLFGLQAAFVRGKEDYDYTGNNGQISQNINMPAGVYSISIYADQRDSYTMPLNILLDGTVVDTFTPVGGGQFTCYTLTNISVTSTGLQTLVIEAAADAGTDLIDNIQIRRIGDVPATIAAPTLYAATGENGQVALSFNGIGVATTDTVFYGTSPTSLTSTLTITDAIESNNYFDGDGNVIATINSTGAATKYAYDGADRNTFVYATDGGQVNNFSNVSIGSSTAFTEASSVAHDIVLSQTENIFDPVGDVIESITSDRFGTDANSATGPLGSPTNAAPTVSDGHFDTPAESPSSPFVYDVTGTPWTFTGDAGLVANGSIAGYVPSTPDGSQAAVLQITGTMSQSILFTVGTYNISFLMAQRQGGYGGQNFDVLVDGKIVDSCNASGTSYVSETTSSFYVTSGMHTITFEGLDSAGGDHTDFVDAVSLNNVTTAFARVSYSASYFDAADRDIADVNVGTNGGSPWTPPAYSSLSRSGTELVTSHVYDAAGNLQFVTDPLGIVTAYGYDALGQMTVQVNDEIPTMGPVSTTSLPTPMDSYNQITTYTYDGDGHVLTMTANMPSGEISQVTHYVYGVSTSTINNNDLLYQVQYPDPVSGTNTSTGTYNQAESYSYDALGEQTGYTDRNLTVHAYTYDSLGRLTSDSVTIPSGSTVDTSVQELAYTYGADGLMSTATSYNTSNTSTQVVVNQAAFTYDGFGQLLSDTQAHYGTVDDDGTAEEVDYTYDVANGDRLTGMSSPGLAITYVYAAGLDAVLSRITAINCSMGTLQSYTYLGLDTPVTFTDGNGNTLSYLGTIGSSSGDAGDQYTGLDRFGRVIDQKWQNSSGTVVDEQKYGYDADSNVLYQDNTVSAMSGRSELFTYDGLNRLTNLSVGSMTFPSGTPTISSPTKQQGWNLNAVGGWNSSSTTVSGTTTTVTRDNNAQNQVKNISSGSTTLGYDKNGNTLTDNNGHTYTYDAWNRLISVTVGSDTFTYTYDALGRRITESDSAAGSNTDLYFSNRDQVIEEDISTSSYSATNTYIWSAFYVNQIVAENQGPASSHIGGGGTDSFGGGGVYSGTWLFAQQDADYNVTSLADGSGNVVERYSYDPYGLQTVYNASGSVLSGSAYQWIYGFQGGSFNPTAGLVHFGARDENTGTGSWLEQDPAGVRGSGPNFYQFENLDSPARIDPNGKQSIPFPVPIAPAVGTFPPTGNPNPWFPPAPVAPAPVPAPVLPTIPTPGLQGGYFYLGKGLGVAEGGPGLQWTKDDGWNFGLEGYAVTPGVVGPFVGAGGWAYPFSDGQKSNFGPIVGINLVICSFDEYTDFDNNTKYIGISVSILPKLGIVFGVGVIVNPPPTAAPSSQHLIYQVQKDMFGVRPNACETKLRQFDPGRAEQLEEKLKNAPPGSYIDWFYQGMKPGRIVMP